MSLHVSPRGLRATAAAAQSDGWKCLGSGSPKDFQSAIGPRFPEFSQLSGPVREQDSQALPFQKAPKYQNQLILGVMAVDVSLEDIKRLTPHFTVRVQTRPVHTPRV